MSCWLETTLGEACELYQPKTISSAELIADGEYPVYGANGVIGRFDKFNHAEPQLLITCRGATCGSVNVSQPNSWINGNAMVVKPKDISVEIDYLKHLFNGGLDLSAVITGAAQPQITRQSLAPLKVRFPAPIEQRRIAAILDQADALRVQRREALAQLDNLTQSIFIEMFGDPATNPKNWKIVPLGDVLDGLTDYHANGSYEVLRSHVELLDTPDYALMLRTTDLEKNNFSTGVKYITESAYYFLKKSQVFGGEIVINKIGSAGNVYLAPFLNRPISLGMNSFLLRITKCANSRFIFDVLTSDYIGGIIRSKVRGAVTKTITKEAVRSVEIPLPPLEMQNEYVKRIKVVEEQKVIHHTSLAELNILFASLQHRAFRGEL